jgi:hypothetical protein
VINKILVIVSCIVLPVALIGGAVVAFGSMVDDWHYLLFGAGGLVAVAVAVSMVGGALGSARGWVDWWTARSMALDVHRVAVEKARLDLALVQPSTNGTLPVARALLEDGVLTQHILALAAQHVANGRPVQPVPNTFHYNVTGGEMGKAASMPALLADVAQFATPPTFTEMFDGGLVSAGKFILGYTQTGEPLHGSIKDIYSNLIIAKSGAGKTTLQRYLMAQAALGGARIWVADPHGATDEGMVAALAPLEKHFACKPAVEIEDIEGLVRAFVSMGEARIKGHEKSKSIQILAIDELNVIAEDAPNVVVMIIRAARAYRKVGMYVSASCQSALAADLGGTTGVRASFVARYVLKSDKDVVNKLVTDRKLLEMVPTLERGRAIFVPANGEAQPLAIPNTTVEDLRDCFEDVTEVADDDDGGKVDESGENGQNTDNSGAQVVDPLSKPLSKPLTDPLIGNETGRANLSPKQMQAINLFKSGESKTQIIAAVWGAKGGPPFQAASAEFDEALRVVLDSR